MEVQDIIRPDQDPSGIMAEFAANLKYEDIPEDHIEYLKKDLLDAIACIISGSTGPAVSTVVESLRSYETTGKGRIFLYGDRLPEPMAAFANGTIIKTVDIGDTGVTGGHICEWIIPTILSALTRSDKPVSGKDFITAFVAGAEWGTREHTTIRLQPNNQLTPGECAGSRYAAVALAKLFGFNKEEIWSAAGMAYCLFTMTTMQKYAEGSPDGRMYNGYVAAAAIQIIDLIKRGMRSIQGIYMGHSGLLKSIRHSNIESPDTLTDGLGKIWMWKDNITNKIYGGCYYFHAAIYGILDLMKKNGIRREEIAGIHIITSPAREFTYVPHEAKYAPTSAGAGMFSAPYSIAHAVFTGDCFLEAYEKEVFDGHMKDPVFRDFMHIITQESDPSIHRTFDDQRITITLKNGKTFSCVARDIPGSQENAISWEQVIEKFRKAEKYSLIELGEEKGRRIIDICKHLDEIEDMTCLVDALMP